MPDLTYLVSKLYQRPPKNIDMVEWIPVYGTIEAFVNASKGKEGIIKESIDGNFRPLIVGIIFQGLSWRLLYDLTMYFASKF